MGCAYIPIAKPEASCHGCDMDKLDYSKMARERSPEDIATDSDTALRWAQLRERTFAVSLLTVAAAAARRADPKTWAINVYDAGTLDRLQTDLEEAIKVRQALELAFATLTPKT
jgi:hypothetical protein